MIEYPKPDPVDLTPVNEARQRLADLEKFVRTIAARMTSMIQKSGNVEYVNTTAAQIRQEAEDFFDA